MQTCFKKIGIVARDGGSEIRLVLDQLITFLVQSGRHVVLEQACATRFFITEDYPSATINDLPKVCDLVIVIGGDGSFLGAARKLIGFDVPLVGVNKGTLGFLTDISPDAMQQQLREILDGEYDIDERSVLEAILLREDEETSIGLAVNDVVIRAGDVVSMIEFDLCIDGQEVYSQRSDGLIISTPTGSTAYALSGGGPIVHPSLDAVVLVPMHPHTLSSRPIVVNGDSEIELRITGLRQPVISCDGLQAVHTEQGDVVRIKKRKDKIQLLHPKNHNFYEACRVKLGWSSHLTK